MSIDTQPKVEKIANGWAAYGNGWAVHAQNKEEVMKKFEERNVFYRQILSLPPYRSRIKAEKDA